jgi:hypothetical protein
MVLHLRARVVCLCCMGVQWPQTARQPACCVLCGLFSVCFYLLGNAAPVATCLLPEAFKYLIFTAGVVKAGSITKLL